MSRSPALVPVVVCDILITPFIRMLFVPSTYAGRVMFMCGVSCPEAMCIDGWSQAGWTVG